MEIVSLEPVLEPIFWEHVKQDVPHHYFFAFDWKYNKDDTRILLALEGQRIEGMMLIYRETIVQLRGSLEAVKALLEKLDLKEVELQSPEQHEQYVLQKYEPTWSHKMILMVLHRGEERLHAKHQTVKLATSDAEQIATIMRDTDPEYWGITTRQGILDGMNGLNWLGTRVNGDLVSIGSTRLTEWAGLIGVVATIEAHRNRGYATSIVSEMVKRILEKQPIALIYVLSDNPPAIRVYRKVGFKPYRTYFFMRGERH